MTEEQKLARLEQRFEELDRRLDLLERDGSPNLRERTARLEGQMQHLYDPEAGVFPQLRTASEQLRSWAIALLTALLIAICVLLYHIITGR